MSFNQISAIDVMIYKPLRYCYFTGLISKAEAKISLQNADLTEKSGTL